MLPMRILKYELEIKDRQTIPIGNGQARPLSAAEQNGKLMLWCMVKEDFFPADYKCSVVVDIVGTGHFHDDKCQIYKSDFVGTVVMRNGFVWHVFAREELPKDNNVPKA